ncbi:sigma-70 family RNA polymerase sigma factor [Luteolibacter algae]|uniref:Sigma-70 family RNA polymerase sigma factor n=1 Tax=Luteolibacter algae TaxID=454151 RepID=A0ABW5D5D5_9BACT
MSNPDQGEQFSSLLMANRHRIYGFLYSLVHQHQAAEDLMQEVSMILWRKFDQFEIGTDFAVWAMSVGRFCVLNWRRKQARLPLSLDDDDLIRLADEAVSVACEDDMRGSLKECMRLLPEKLKKVLRARYHRDLDVKEIAKRNQQSVRAVYLLLEKSHGLLLDCVSQKLGKPPQQP